ncbi:putative phage head protein [Pseudomonas sp. SID14000]|uniref:putative phage head protein n=1 Tax=Pseudomonas sp. SID14000 TaxID=1986221 RepID=UPI000B3C6E0A
MCFSSKVKTPKVSSAIPAPEPILLDNPKGVEYGSGDGTETSTDNVAKVDKDDTSASVGSALDKPKVTAKPSTGYSTSAIKKSLAKRTS